MGEIINLNTGSALPKGHYELAVQAIVLPEIEASDICSSEADMETAQNLALLFERIKANQLSTTHLKR